MNRKAKKPVELWIPAVALFGAMLAILSALNLTGRNAPVTRINDRIVDDLTAAGALPVEQQAQAIAQLREEQEQALARKPAEPFAWARLAYLRLATGADAESAFAALRMSDLVSPDEPRQLPERALMWRHFANIESADQREYQKLLWRKAFRMEGDATWTVAAKNHITDEVGTALLDGEPGYYDQWQARRNSNP